MIDLSYSAFSSGLVFGEGLRWYRGRLWLSDMLARVVYTYDENAVQTTVARIPERPNGLGFLPDGRLLITSMGDQRLLLREPDGVLKVYADLSSLMTGYCGDMAVDRYGGIYLDDVGFRVFEEERKPGRLIRIEPNGEARTLLDGLGFPNGIWINKSGDRLIFAEGHALKLHSFTMSPSGELIDQRILPQPEGRKLDGLTLDVADGIWICCPQEKEILRVLEDGQVTHRIAMRLSPISCCLGGPERKTLYIVAADYTLERMKKDDVYAELFTAGVDVPGFPLPGDQ